MGYKITINEVISYLIGIGSLIFAIWIFLRDEQKNQRIKHILLSLYAVRTDLHSIFLTTTDIENYVKKKQHSQIQGSIVALKNHIVGILDNLDEILLVISNLSNERPEVEMKIIHGKKLALREGRSKQIWIITNDLYEAEENVFADVVINNLKTGSTYRYIMPDTLPLRTKAVELTKRYENVLHHALDDRYYHLAIPIDDYPFMTEIIIYDADDLMNREAFWMLPDSSSKKRAYIKLDRETCENAIILFREIWRKSYDNHKPEL